MHILTVPTSDSFVIDCHVCMALGEGTYIGIMVKILIKNKIKWLFLTMVNIPS